jgi:release factor glutamine methyltransferase
MSALTVAQALHTAHTAGVERLDAQRLLATTLGQPRSWLLAHGEHPLSAAEQQQFAAWLARCLDGEPLAYLLGEHEFHGLTLQVSPDVLVPRADTETLVDWGLELLQTAPWAHTPQPTVIDLGTGSGAIALAIKHRHPAAQVTALDASPAALAMAQRNGQQLQLPVRFALSHWWQAMAGQRFDLALSNPPYIAGLDPHLPALRHEPRMALTPEGDGLAALREIIEHAPKHLHPGGWLLLEHGYDQAAAVHALLHERGFAAISTRHDLAGQPRCTGGCWA